MALRYDVWFKWLLWAVSNPVSSQFNLVCSVMHKTYYNVWACTIILRAWAEHYPVTRLKRALDNLRHGVYFAFTTYDTSARTKKRTRPDSRTTYSKRCHGPWSVYYQNVAKSRTSAAGYILLSRTNCYSITCSVYTILIM